MTFLRTDPVLPTRLGPVSWEAPSPVFGGPASVVLGCWGGRLEASFLSLFPCLRAGGNSGLFSWPVSPRPEPFGGSFGVPGRCVFRSWPLRRTSCPSAQSPGPKIHFSQGRFGPRSFLVVRIAFRSDHQRFDPSGPPPQSPVWVRCRCVAPACRLQATGPPCRPVGGFVPPN